MVEKCRGKENNKGGEKREREIWEIKIGKTTSEIKKEEEEQN